MSDIKQFALRLPSELVAQVDRRAKAKGKSRNQWFEEIAKAAVMMEGEHALEATVPTVDARAHDGMVESWAERDKSRRLKSKPVAKERHLHRLVKGEEAGYHQGKKVYLYTCECGETEVR